MPSDNFYERLYEHEDSIRSNKRCNLEKSLKKMFNDMTTEEKLDYLIKEYINIKVNEIK